MSIDRRFPPDAYVIYKDGNCWFAVRTDFVDLQASHSGVLEQAPTQDIE